MAAAKKSDDQGSGVRSTLEDTPYKPDDYSAVARAAELDTIQLQDLKFMVEPKYFEEKLEEKSRAKYHFRRKFQNAVYDSKVGFAGADFCWEVYVNVGRKKVLTIKATYVIFYNNLNDMNGGAVCAFIKGVGRYATYPYFRALVSQLSWESSADLPTMPVISTNR